MEAIKLLIEGNWAHFKKPETNNNPLTHDFITKTALIGLLGAVLGKERNVMRPLFPQLSDDLLYGVQVLNSVKKESWGFTMRKAVNVMEKAPKYIEVLKKPEFLVSIALSNKRSEEIFNKFIRSIKNNEARFTPVFGLHNCPANIMLIDDGQFAQKQFGEFKTRSFISKKHILNIGETRQFRIGFEKIPTYQNGEFWNLPEKYIEVVYPSEKNEITVKGEYYKFSDGECWWLI